jgi:hypothetical protein
VESWTARLSTRDRRVWGSVGPWGFRGGVSAPGRSPTRPSLTFGASVELPRARRLFTCARRLHVRTGEFEDLATAAAGGKFPSHSATPVVFLPPLPCDVFTQLGRFRLCCLYSGCPKIAPPSVHPAGVHSRPRSASPLAWLALRCLRGGGCHRALARPAFVPTSPFPRSRRLAPPAGYRACARPRSWGSPRFPRPRLSPPPRSPPRVPALRSLAPRRTLRPPLTRWPRRLVSPVVADGIHRAPSLLVLSPAAFATGRNLEGFLVQRSRTPVRCCQRRRAVAPLGLSIL